MEWRDLNETTRERVNCYCATAANKEEEAVAAKKNERNGPPPDKNSCNLFGLV
jgi:hypothetical protein